MKLASCHPNRKAEGRDLCKNCYDKWLKENNPEYKERQLQNKREWYSKHKDEVKMKERERRRKRRLADLTQFRLNERKRLLKTYGLTTEDYELMLQKQRGGCAICERKPTPGTNLHVDHDHKTGRVRGLLCHQCNWFLGTIDAEPDILTRLSMYLTFKYDSYIMNKEYDTYGL